MDEMVKLQDAGTPWPLASKSYMYFARGFYGIETANNEDGGSDIWRWVERHAELRVRARSDGPLRLRVRGRGAHFDGNESMVGIRVNGHFSRQFATRNDFEVELELAPNARINDTFVVEFDSDHSYAPPDDGRDLAFSITEIVCL